MPSIIKIKRSGTQGSPASLKSGELAYSYFAGANRLYFGKGDDGSGNATEIVVIGGQYFTDMLDHTPGVLTTSSAVITDADNKVDIFNVDNLRLDLNTISSTNVNGNIILAPNGSGSISLYNVYTLPSTAGIGGQALVTNGTNAATWGIPNTATNIAAGTAGQIVYQSAAGTTAFAGPGTAGQVLTSDGTNGPTYVTTTTLYVGRALTADSASGTSNQANNLNGGILGQIPYQTAANATAFIGTGTNGSILQMGANTATFVTTSSIYVNSAVNANTLRGGTTGQLVYQSGAGTTAFAGPGTAGQILVSAGAAAPVYTNTGSIYINSAVNAQTLFGGTAGQLVYQSGAGTTAFAGPGTAGQLLVSAGTGAPTYTNTSSIYVGFANSSNNVRGGVLGQIPYQTAANTTAFIGTGTAGTILQMGANTATFVATSTIYVNRATLADNDSGGAAGGLRYQTGANASTFLPIGTAGQILRVNAAANAPEWLTTSSGYLGFANQSNNLLAGTAGQVPYQTAAGATSFFGPGTAGQILVSAGTNAPTYTNTTSIQVGFANVAGVLLAANTATQQVGFADVAGQLLAANTSTQQVGFSANLLSGSTGSVPYQSAANTTAMLPLSATNGALLTAGASAPAYITQVTARSGTGNTTTASGQSLVVGNGGLGVIGDSHFADNVNVRGDLTVTGGTTFEGSVTFNGTATFVYSTNTFYTDNIVNLHTPQGGIANTWTTNDGKDIGFVFHNFVDNYDNDAFLGYANDTGYLEWYAKGTESTTGTYVGAAYGIFKTGGIILDNNTGVNNATSGALQVSGGVGVAGGIFVGGVVTATTFVGGLTGTATQANNLNNGTAGQIPYQTGANATSFFGPGTAGQLLVSGGTAAPVYTNTGSIYVGSTVNAEKWRTARTVTFTGDTTGTFTIDGSADVSSVVLTIQPDSVALGVDTTGNYVEQAATAGWGLSGSVNSEGGTFTVTSNATSTNTVSTLVFRDGTGNFRANVITADLVGTASNANDLTGGAAGSIPYQTSAGVTDFLALAASGKILQVDGAGTSITWGDIDGGTY